MKTTTKPIHLFAPIERVDEEERTVTAFAFVNEVVPGEGGVRLTRASMEAATPDYMQWANIRRMHQADAVGVAESVDWQEKGAKMVLHVVDEDAWQKVKRGVYKGLSVGVVPTVMRGKDVTACRWIETSLVDRPKDPDAVITMVRAEGVDPDAEVEVEQLEEERVETAEPPAEEIVPEAEQELSAEERAEAAHRDWAIRFADALRTNFHAAIERYKTEQPAEDESLVRRTLTEVPPPWGEGILTFERAQDSSTVPTRENLEGPKGDTHYSCGADGYCHGHTTRGGAQECMEREAQGMDQHISAVEEHLAALKAKRRAENGEDEGAIQRTEELPDPATAPPNELLTRVDTIPADQLSSFTTTILTRLEVAESGLAEERQQHAVTKERAETLAKMPAVTRPAKFTALARSDFHADGAGPDQAKLRAEMQEAYDAGIQARDNRDEALAGRCMDRYQRLKMELQSLS